ncbi:MAG: NAD(P)-dependent oxidoreductase [Nitrososphaerota archaeon]|nr:NAD(P)-dependent oxidoreductase [Nitrososphaerota archaeon]MDG7024282.1 NAD(P)-dependent oxidoreductase [Nitrososphaerota archaeon]
MSLKTERTSKFPFPKLDASLREGNFEEVQLPYTAEEAMAEASRCLTCGNPVCIDICPLQTDVRGMCEAVSRGDFATAYQRARETNPLLGTTARCCPQLDSLCEAACVLGTRGQPVASGMIQRFVADWERAVSRQPDPKTRSATGKKVAVVGGGPAGLAAAELLTRYGHSVTIYEELPVLGGTAWYGIPDYHLPKDVLQYEASRIVGMGVEVKSGVKVGRDLELSDLRSDYDAVLIATGAKDVSKFDTPGADLRGVYDGYRFLEDVFVGGVERYLEAPTYSLGKRVLVIGGGDSALDCARTALRLTGGEVTIVYRRTEAEMPVDEILIDEGKEEGLRLRFLLAPKAYDGKDGKVVRATMSVMKLGDVDSSGRRSPVPTGETVDLECDSVIIAIGRGPNSFLQRKAGIRAGPKGGIATDDHGMTSMQGVFAGGDVVTGESLVVRAMSKGREAAQRLHEYLMGLEAEHESLYDYYFTRRTTGRYYRGMMEGKEEALPPD